MQDQKILELLSNHDSRLKLLSREIELHGEKLKEIRDDLESTHGMAQDTAQRSAAPMEKINYLTIRLDALFPQIESLQKRVEELATWKIKRESQFEVWRFMATIPGILALLLQLFGWPVHPYPSDTPAPAAGVGAGASPNKK